MQAVLTVVADKETDLDIAGALGKQLVAQGKIQDVWPAVPARGVTYILLASTTHAQRAAIIDQIHAAGFKTIEAD
ncbi:MAG TPA: hypothetical protein VEU51_11645 [Candidatus Acidoferrales bacterium]|nr:hypothetical protein [Candidatus Acidoferrales bacterium]